MNRTWGCAGTSSNARINASATGGVPDDYRQPPVPRGHAVALEGYTPTHFIVRNSWDTSWGDRAYGYATLPYTESAFTEAYGVSV